MATSRRFFSGRSAELSRCSSAPAPSAWIALGQAVLFLHLALSPLLFSRNTLEVFEYGKVALLQGTAILLGAVGLSMFAWQLAQTPGRCGPLEILHTWLKRLGQEPMALGFVLLLASAAVSTATSISPRTSLAGAHESFAGLLTILAGTILFFATRALCGTREAAGRLLAAPILGAAVASTYAVLQAAHLDPISWDKVSRLVDYVRPFGTMGHPNHLAAFLVMTLPVTVWFAWQGMRGRDWLSVSILALVGMVSLVAILLAASRGAWLALACALSVLLIGWIRGRTSRHVMLAASSLSLVALLGVVAVTGLASGEILGHLIERIRHWNESAGRIYIWRAGWNLFCKHPFVGCGVDTFQLAFGQERPVAYWHVEWNITPTRAHNEIIHILATQGLLGGAAIAVLVAGLLRAAVRAWRLPASDDRTCLTALVAGVAAFCVHDFFSFTVAGCGTLFITFAALLSRLEQPALQVPARQSRGWLLSVVLASVLALLIFLGNALPSRSLAGFATWLGCLAIVTALTLVSFVLLRLEARHPSDLDRDMPCSVASPRRHAARFARWAWVVSAIIWSCAALLLVKGLLRPVQADIMCREGDRLLAEAPQQALATYARAAAINQAVDLCWVKVANAAQVNAAAASSGQARRQLLLQARQALDRACALVPINAYHHANLGQVLAALAREGFAASEQAFAEFDAAIALDPNNVYFYADATNASLGIRDAARARRYAACASALYPEFSPVRAQQGYIALLEGRLEEAARLLSQTLGSDWFLDEEGRVTAWTTLAATLLQLHHGGQALQVVQAVVARAPDHVDAHFIMGRALEMLGRPQEALGEYARVLRLRPDHQRAREAAQRLGRPFSN